MKPFTSHRGIVAPIDRANVDTDAILPKQFMKSIERTGFGPFLFDGWRYLDPSEPGVDCTQRALNPDFVLNQPRYAGASILLARRNFGCGSSREHAPWALEQFGLRALIAPSFADIFFGNCLKNGLLPIVLSEDSVDRLFQNVLEHPGFELEVDLERQSVKTPSGECFAFDIEAQRKESLLIGLDEISTTLTAAPRIKTFETQRRSLRPWLFDAPGESGAKQA